LQAHASELEYFNLIGTSASFGMGGCSSRGGRCGFQPSQWPRWRRGTGRDDLESHGHPWLL